MSRNIFWATALAVGGLTFGMTGLIFMSVIWGGWYLFGDFDGAGNYSDWNQPSNPFADDLFSSSVGEDEDFGLRDDGFTPIDAEDGFSSATSMFDDMDSGPSVNPASGLPMMDSMIDVAGNPYGTDLHDTFGDDGFSSGSIGSDDSFMNSGFDDDFSSTSFNDDW